MSLNDIYTLPPAEKLHLIEALWDQLEDKDVEVPKWHQEVLEERKERYSKGELKLISLEELKQKKV